MSSFENLRVVDNFFQTSSFFPNANCSYQPLCENGTTNCGP